MLRHSPGSWRAQQARLTWEYCQMPGVGGYGQDLLGTGSRSSYPCSSASVEKKSLFILCTPPCPVLGIAVAVQPTAQHQGKPTQGFLQTPAPQLSTHPLVLLGCEEKFAPAQRQEWNPCDLDMFGILNPRKGSTLRAWPRRTPELGVYS